MGRGRHALVLAQHGFHTFGVDLNLDAIRDAMQKAARDNLQIRGWCADLTVSRLAADARSTSSSSRVICSATCFRRSKKR